MGLCILKGSWEGPARSKGPLRSDLADCRGKNVTGGGPAVTRRGAVGSRSRQCDMVVMQWDTRRKAWSGGSATYRTYCSLLGRSLQLADPCRCVFLLSCDVRVTGLGDWIPLNSIHFSLVCFCAPPVLLEMLTSHQIHALLQRL